MKKLTHGRSRWGMFRGMGDEWCTPNFVIMLQTSAIHNHFPGKLDENGQKFQSIKMLFVFSKKIGGLSACPKLECDIFIVKIRFNLHLCYINTATPVRIAPQFVSRMRRSCRFIVYSAFFRANIISTSQAISPSTVAVPLAFANPPR